MTDASYSTPPPERPDRTAELIGDMIQSNLRRKATSAHPTPRRSGGHRGVGARFLSHEPEDGDGG